MRDKNLPTTGQAVFVTDTGDHVQVCTERPAWVTTKVCIVRCEDNKVSWIDQDKLISKAEWDNQQKEKEDDSERVDQG